MKPTKVKSQVLSKSKDVGKRRLHRMVGLRGTARCVRCGRRHSDMPLDRLDQYACAKYDLKAGQPCGGDLMQVEKHKQLNDQAH